MKPYSWILKSFTWCGFWRLCSCFAGWTLCASSPSSLKTINCSFTSALKRHRLATNFYHAAYIVTAYHLFAHRNDTCILSIIMVEHTIPYKLSLSLLFDAFCVLSITLSLTAMHQEPLKILLIMMNWWKERQIKSFSLSEYKRKDVLILSAEWYNEGESSLGVVQTPNTNCPVISWVIFN